MAMGAFQERGDPEELAAYQSEELAKNFTRDDLVDSMEGLLLFTRGSIYQWTDDWEALIYATVARSARTFEAVCMLLRDGLAVQAAMLCRSLFEDMVVGHFLLYNYKDRKWLVEKFLRQREAIALHQRKLQRQAKGAMGPPISMAKDARSRAKALEEEFGSEVNRDWWNPGRKGKGIGNDVTMRKVIGKLQDAADRHEMFHPRFAGGAEKLLRRTELIANKWFNQCIHHTTVGLPFTPTETGEVEKPLDPMVIVSFSATWIFAQQVYLAHDLAQKPGKRFEAMFWQFMLDFSQIISPGSAEVEKLEAQFDQILVEMEAEVAGMQEGDADQNQSGSGTS